jgi:putative peptidoglycan lipid II flippase
MSRISMLVVSLALLALGKVTGFLKDIALTFFHGVSEVTDAYFLTSSLASIVYIAIYMAIPIVTVPVYSQALKTGKIPLVERELSSLCYLLSVISLIISVLVFSCSGQIVRALTSSVDASVIELSESYLKIVAVSFTFSTLVAFSNALQTVKGVKLPAYSIPIVNNLGFCLGLVVFTEPSDFHLILMLGTGLWIMLAAGNMLICGRYFRFRLPSAPAQVFQRRFLLVLVPALLTFYVEYANSYVGIYFASSLELGAVTIYSYANKISLIATSVFLVFLTINLFPKISGLAVSSSREEMLKYFSSAISIIAFFALPLALYLAFFSKEIVSLLFLRGNFTQSDVLQVAPVFAIIIIGVPFLLLKDLSNRIFFAYGKTGTPVSLCLIAILLNILLCAVLYESYRVAGLAVASVASAVVSFFASIFILGRWLGSDSVGGMLRNAAACLLSSMVSLGVVGYFVAGRSLSWLFFPLPYLLIYLLLVRLFSADLMRSICASLRAAALHR